RAECTADGGTVRHEPSRRSTSYGSLAAAASRLSVPKNPPWRAREERRLIGKRVARVDGPAIVTGKAVYGLDARPAGALVAVIARPPVPGGKVLRVNDAKAKAVKGVRRVARIPTGVAVVADSTWAAMEGCEALEVTFDDGPNGSLDTAALWKMLENGFATSRNTRKEGDADAALAAAVANRKHQAEYRYPFQAHATLEPMNCVADARGGRCVLWCPTQAPNRVQGDVARALGIAEEAVTVNVTLMGGGFGRRLGSDYAVEAAQLSKAIDAAVQVVYTRADDFAEDYVHPASIDRLSAALDEHGLPVAWSHTMCELHLTMFGNLDLEDKDTWEGSPWGGYDTPYRVPNLKVDYFPVASPVRTGAWRAVTYPPGVFARECFLDELAHLGGWDPLKYRLALLDGPDARVGRMILERGRLRNVVALAAQKAGWGTPLPKGQGRGLACNVYHGRTAVAQVAEVEVSPAGEVRVKRVVCAVDCGEVVNLWGLEAQFEGGVVWGLTHAAKSEVTYAKGRIQQTTFGDFPVLRIDEMPRVEVHVVPSTRRPSGIGEQPVPPVAPAVANAIFAATGKRIRSLPFGRPTP
ncbi:MAG: xanthine dehydrogenase family protein molybdopterin-binding subunit, partial [Acidobacteria bacterium]|nr:xanthine dehydrogenase family protein molybdopterin-binding subunit [Acidobacteriota bacterium]